MTAWDRPWLTETEVLDHRMAAFHRDRLEWVRAGGSCLGQREDGLLLLHLIPHECVRVWRRLDDPLLRDHGKAVTLTEGNGVRSRFNADGVLNTGWEPTPTAYAQIFRDGRLEVAVAATTMPASNQPAGSRRLVAASICERATLHALNEHLKFAKAVGLTAPIRLLASISGCAGLKFSLDPGWGDESRHSIDRSPAHLPWLDLPALDAGVEAVHRQWCDWLWQAAGEERSPNFTEGGKRRFG